jgi:hypothetical protein
MVNDELGNAALPTDGFDSIFDELVAIVEGLDQALGVLAGELVSAFGEADTIDAAPVGDTLTGFAGALPASSSAVDDLGTLLAGTTPPAPTGGGGGGGGGSGPPSTNCSQRTNQYGISATGAFPGVTCDVKDTFQVLRVQDGPCTYSAVMYPTAGHPGFPRITSFTLVTGDPTVWKLAHHQEKASDGTLVDLYDITVTPKIAGNQSHFDATGRLVMTQPARTLTVCMSVDFIP